MMVPTSTARTASMRVTWPSLGADLDLAHVGAVVHVLTIVAVVLGAVLGAPGPPAVQGEE